MAFASIPVQAFAQTTDKLLFDPVQTLVLFRHHQDVVIAPTFAFDGVQVRRGGLQIAPRATVAVFISSSC